MKYLPIYLIAVGILFAGCSAQMNVRSDYDREINLRQYKTYNWLAVKEIESKNEPLYYNELTDKRIKKAVDLQLRAKSINKDSLAPSLRVHYHIAVDSRSSIRPTNYGYAYGPYWMRNQMDSYSYREGTLIIDLMDAKNNNLVWRGWASSVLNDNDIDLSETKITEAVLKILQQFPPSK